MVAEIQPAGMSVEAWCALPVEGRMAAFAHLPRQVVRRWRRTAPIWLDDIESIARLRLYRFCARATSERFASWDHVVRACNRSVSNAAIDEVCRLTGYSRKSRCHRIAWVQMSEDGARLAMEALPSQEPAPWADVQREDARTELLRGLMAVPIRDRTIAYEHYFLGRSQASLAEERGLTPTRICQILHEVHGRLRPLIAR